MKIKLGMWRSKISNNKLTTPQLSSIELDEDDIIDALKLYLLAHNKIDIKDVNEIEIFQVTVQEG